jgi:hypothetical protein
VTLGACKIDQTLLRKVIFDQGLRSSLSRSFHSVDLDGLTEAKYALRNPRQPLCFIDQATKVVGSIGV